MQPHPNEDIVMNIDWSKIPTNEKQNLLAQKLATNMGNTTKVFTLLECYIDDFIAMIQTTDETKLREMTRCLLHAITTVFPPPEVTGLVMGPPIAPKKLVKEGAWESSKTILGWLINGITQTIRLPQEKCDALIKLLKHKFILNKSISIKDLQSIQGKLQFASIGIPLGKPLLGPIDQKLARALANPNIKSIKIGKELDDYSRNWRAILKLMRSRPSHANELIMQETNAFRGLVDASGWGCGGVWFSGTKNLTPIVWYYRWNAEVCEQLCTAENPEGPITISDLKLCGIFIQWLVLEQAVGLEPLKHQSPAIWCDNISAVSWTRKLRSNISPLAGSILRAFATHLHTCESSMVAVDHISGTFNILSHIASRKHSTNDLSFLQSFTQSFPPPKGAYWTLCKLHTKIISHICSQLLTKTSKMASWRRLGRKECVFSVLGKDGL